MKFDYDAFGQRIAKHIYSIGTTPTWEESTYYVRDAQGNVMGTYRLKFETGGKGFTPFLSYKITERPIYGSSRVGLNGFHRDLLPFAPMTPGQDPYAPSTYPPIRKKMYELSNHLGNVLSVVSDAKFPTVATVGTPIQSYNADVVSYSDFMPFGSTMTGRTFSSEKYRYGFNGKENDNEVKGQGNQQDYGFRIYDPRLGRFLSVDPLTKKYPFWSPFAFAGNSPIYAIDLDGLEIRNSYFNYSSNGTKLELKNPNDKEVADFIDKEIASLMHDDKSLYDYVNQHKVDVDGRELTQSEGFDHLGNITFTAAKQDDQALT